MAEKLPRVVIVGGGFGGPAAGGDRRPDARADYIPIVVADACGAGHQEAADRHARKLTLRRRCDHYRGGPSLPGAASKSAGITV